IFNVFSKQYFLKREKGFNVTLGDINNDCDFKYKTLIKGLRFKSFKALLKLNLKEFSGYLNELKLLKKRYPSILRSRKLNKEIGIKYLSGLN
ncbi:MAG: hypothetical protein CL817_00005, partial [Croceibacter sp.]|nr:hypothetical protein [Croceibacter sp.]